MAETHGLVLTTVLRKLFNWYEYTYIVTNSNRGFEVKVEKKIYTPISIFHGNFTGLYFPFYDFRSCPTRVDLMVARLLRIYFLHWLKIKVTQRRLFCCSQ
jgi:hypothetical protein